MTDDATLSSFTGSTDRADDERGQGREESNGDRTDRASDGDSSEHGTVPSTYAWGSYTCQRCETTVERVWRDEGTLVCPGCKSW
ncbi:hypothetical protein QA600_15680 [Natronococcus sp. A-GB1]|uniref:DUF7573 domain-containing protein n=1 Tax=Natronococcus sp. A-GB1 TaxID=3037648 RepID=UPI00241EDDC2|nr:hypothetical protein [Natronococcus sp. A-GB1]MDG5760778.1 hypothetical protein [Natronococcus sp. A-GB1]